MVEKNNDVLVIFGPTASGKTALGIGLAEALGGEIINADSRQVYRHMPIINACPTPQEHARVPHHLFEFLDPEERFSSARWAEMAAEVIGDVRRRGKVPIVVGGTGFYLRVLMEGLDAVPDVPEEAELPFAGRDARELHAELARVDAALAEKLQPTDTQRIVRGLAVHAHTGRPLSAWQAGEGRPGLAARYVKMGVMPERAALHARIERRWEMMLEAGVVEEVRALKAKGYTVGMPGVQGLGIMALHEHLEGRRTLAAAVEAGVASHRQYAKRQCTWLKNSYRADRVFERADVGEVLGWLKA